MLSVANRSGVTIFMVEQNAKLALAIASRGYVLQSGIMVLEGTAQALLDNPLFAKPIKVRVLYSSLTICTPKHIFKKYV